MTTVLLRCSVPVDHLSLPGIERVVLLTGRVGKSTAPGDEQDVFIVEGMHPTANRDRNPQYDFTVFARDIKRVERTTGATVIGVVHSHLDYDPAWPSESDYDGLPDDMIGGVYQRDMIWWYRSRSYAMNATSPPPE